MVDITITIPDDKVEELTTYFLYDHPIPLDDEGEPLYTLLNWFKMWLYKQIVNAYRSGKKRKMWDEFIIEYGLE